MGVVMEINQAAPVHCSICGNTGPPVDNGNKSIRENFACAKCRSALRYRDQGAIIVDEFSDGVATCIDQLVARRCLDDVTILECARRGPFMRRLRGLPRYSQSYYWEDVPFGTEVDGVSSQDLRDLTYETDVFDLIITSDVFEHVFDHGRAFREVHRVLKPGGIHVCSIPVRYPLPANTFIRAEFREGAIVHHAEEIYHVSGEDEPSLVTVDYGADLLPTLRSTGYAASFVRRSSPSVPQMRNATLVCRKSCL